MRKVIILSCEECPFKNQVREHGYHAIECSLLKGYSEIAKEGIRKDCPIKKDGGITAVVVDFKNLKGE